MKTVLLLTFFLLLSFSISLAVLADHHQAPNGVPQEYIVELEKHWEMLYEKNGIRVYERKDAGPGPLAFKAIGVIKAPTMKVLCLLRHVDSSSNWTPNLQTKKTIKEYNFLDAVTYNHNKLPWPASDRDTLLRSTLTIDKERKLINVITKSVVMPEVPEKSGIVRGELHISNFVFKPVPGGTFVDLDAQFDAKGWLPVALVNFVQKDWVYNFLTRLEVEAQKTTLPAGFPEYEKQFNKVLEDLAALDHKK